MLGEDLVPGRDTCARPLPRFGRDGFSGHRSIQLILPYFNLQVGGQQDFLVRLPRRRYPPITDGATRHTRVCRDRFGCGRAGTRRDTRRCTGSRRTGDTGGALWYRLLDTVCGGTRTSVAVTEGHRRLTRSVGTRLGW